MCTVPDSLSSVTGTPCSLHFLALVLCRARTEQNAIIKYIMSSDVKTTTTVAEEIPGTTTVAPEQDDNASGDQGATKLAAVENDAVMENNPLAAPEEIKTAKTSESAISSNPAAVDVETPPKAKEGQTSKAEDPDTVPEDAAEPLAADGLSIIAEDYDQTDTEKTDGAEGDEEENTKADTADEAVDKVRDRVAPVIAVMASRGSHSFV